MVSTKGRNPRKIKASNKAYRGILSKLHVFNPAETRLLIMVFNAAAKEHAHA